RGRRARPAWHPYGRVVDPAGAGWIGVAKTWADNGETRVAKISDAVAASRDVAPGDPDDGSEGVTRERPGAEGLVRIAPPERAPQGDSAILPGSIRFDRPRGPHGRPSDDARPV